jgi:hypothetical protein
MSARRPDMKEWVCRSGGKSCIYPCYFNEETEVCLSGEGKIRCERVADTAPLHCRTPCEHYSSKVSVKTTCPRKNELLFLGGDKTGAQLLQDTLENGCTHAIARVTPAPGRMKKVPEFSIDDRIDYLDFSVSAVVFDIVHCCYLLQTIKCLLRNGGA